MICSDGGRAGYAEDGTDSEDDDDEDDEEDRSEGQSDSMEADDEPGGGDDNDDGLGDGGFGSQGGGHDGGIQQGASVAGNGRVAFETKSPGEDPRGTTRLSHRLGSFNTSMLETPLYVRNPQFSQGGRADPRIIRTPEASPSSNEHFLYCCEIPTKPRGAPSDSAGPAFEACKDLTRTSPNSLALESSTFTAAALECAAPQHISPSHPHQKGSPSTTAANPCRDFIQQWLSQSCFSFILHFRPRPMCWPHTGQEKDTIRFFETSSIPSLPTRRDFPGTCHPDPNQAHILCGIAVSFQGLQSYYWSLLPPLPPRPDTFLLPCLGDPVLGDTPGGTTRSCRPCQGLQQQDLQASSSLLQSLPEARVKHILSYLGYDHSLPTDPTGRYRQICPLNPAFLLCRRWNRVACAWFNERVSNRMWYILKRAMANEGSCKVSWDMVRALAALKERGIDVKGMLEDPKVSNKGPSDVACHTIRISLYS